MVAVRGEWDLKGLGWWRSPPCEKILRGGLLGWGTRWVNALYGGGLLVNWVIYGYNWGMTKATQAYTGLPDLVANQLHKLGEDIAIARKRRRMSRAEMAERMMVNLKTVERMEHGDPGVGIGIVATALWVFGMQRRLGDLIAPEKDMAALHKDIEELPRDFRKKRKENDKFDF
jgi:transcriptional regulator with XRE-family HTH domain